jgi:hypothetical protein
MKPSVGQRWRYNLNSSRWSIVEIVALGLHNNTVQVKVIQKQDIEWKIGEIFSPANLNADGPRALWELMEGQDAPK